jgi:ABC-type glycerol-3-phosphate transport system substrate-binding protein
MSSRISRVTALVAGVGTLVAVAAGTAGTVGVAAATSAHAAKIGGSVSIWAEWTGAEQTQFEAVLKPFEKSTGITVNYAGKGSGTMDTALETAVKGGSPPDVALVPDPGTLDTLAKQHAVKPLGPVIGSESKNYAPAWNTLASVGGKLYGVWFKGANKNTVYYNPALFKAAGIKSAPTTWQQMITDATALRAAGTTPVSLCTDVGWPVADLWQNLYLKINGANDYNALAAHKISWQSSTVTKTFDTMNELVGQSSDLLGGTQGALSETYPECVDKVFPRAGSQPQAAMVIEADFVTTEILANSKKYHAGTTGAGGKACTANPAQSPCYDTFAFPYPTGDQRNAAAIQGAGDVGMLLNSTPQAKALIKYLAAPQSAAIWAKLGGFASPNNKVPLSDYPDAVSQADAKALVHAKAFVFSLDDLQGSWEKDLWNDMLADIKTPTATMVKSLQHTMQTQATHALGH